MLHSDFKLTFGVELEMVIVFHEQLLVEQLRRQNVPRLDDQTFEQIRDKYIVKNPTAEERKAIGTTMMECYHASRGDSYIPWAFTTTQGVGGTGGRSLQGYASEPLHIAAEVLRSDAQTAALRYWEPGQYPSTRTIGVVTTPTQKATTFNNWQVVHDTSIVAMQRPEVSDFLSEQKVCSDGGRSASWKWQKASTPPPTAPPGANDGAVSTAKRKQDDGNANTPTAKKTKTVATNPGNSPGQPAGGAPDGGKDADQDASKDADEWDSYGIELNSRVLQSNNQAHFAELDKICELMRGAACHSHGAKATKFCGFHVHVKPDGQNFDLPTLQNIAWLLVQYEKQIDTLFPKHRRLTDNDAGSTIFLDLGSNLTDLAKGSKSFGNALAALAAARAAAAPGGTAPLGEPSPADLLPRDQMRDLIFATTTLPASDLLRLGIAMGPDKSRVVNFMNVMSTSRTATSGSATLEFRQHEGVVTGYMVQWWVKFVLGLVRLAHYEKLADEDDGTKYPSTSRRAQRDLRDGSIFDLLEDMQFDPQGIEYFDRRAAYLALTDNKYAEPKWYIGDSPLSTSYGSPTADPPAQVDSADSVSRNSMLGQVSESRDGSRRSGSIGPTSPPGPPGPGFTDPFRTPSPGAA